MRKVIIIADWIIDYLTKEHYTFGKILETHYDWIIIKGDKKYIPTFIKVK